VGARAKGGENDAEERGDKRSTTESQLSLSPTTDCHLCNLSADCSPAFRMNQVELLLRATGVISARSANKAEQLNYAVAEPSACALCLALIRYSLRIGAGVYLGAASLESLCSNFSPRKQAPYRLFWMHSRCRPAAEQFSNSRSPTSGGSVKS